MSERTLSEDEIAAMQDEADRLPFPPIRRSCSCHQEIAQLESDLAAAREQQSAAERETTRVGRELVKCREHSAAFESVMGWLREDGTRLLGYAEHSGLCALENSTDIESIVASATTIEALADALCGADWRTR